MTIKLTEEEINELRHARERCQKDFAENIYFKSQPQLFIKLMSLSSKPDYIQDLEKDIKHSRLKIWLESLFQNDKSGISLSLQDRVALVINGISHLPDCKCKMKEMLKS